MPTGMLVPSPASSVAPTPPTGASPSEPVRFALARGVTEGAWVELQPAPANEDPGRTRFDRWRPTSTFVPLEAMALLHEPLARVAPGFDLFLPRLLDATALGRLQTELAATKAAVLSASTAAAARSRWAGSTLVASLGSDAAWLSARADLVATLEALASLAAELARNGQGLWVLAD